MQHKKHNFRELRMWKLGMEVAETVYKMTKGFPKEEIFGLSMQMRKAAVSIPSNIAEGCGRGTDAQLVHFLAISKGSAFELETQVLIAQNQLYATDEATSILIQKINDLEKMIDGFIDRIERG